MSIKTEGKLKDIADIADQEKMGNLEIGDISMQRDVRIMKRLLSQQ